LHLSGRRCAEIGFGRIALVAMAIALVLVLGAAPASAQGLFDFLFGGGRRQQPAAAPPPPPPSATYQRGDYGDSSYGPSSSSRFDTGTGHATMFCVRMCDGRYYPIQQHANASPQQMCSAMCPASQTQIFYGSSIDSASAPGVGPYGNSRNAFLYRKQLVPNCTCNGKDVFGLVTIDVNADPTLRAGDLIATKDGSTKTARPAYATASDPNAVMSDGGGGEVVRVIPPRPVEPQQPQPQQRGFNLFRNW
jgi:hypothetical protein